MRMGARKLLESGNCEKKTLEFSNWGTESVPKARLGDQNWREAWKRDHSTGVCPLRYVG